MFLKIKRAYSFVAAILLTACIVCIIVQIVARYVLSISLPWTEEMARYALVMVTFIGSGCASASGEHLGAFFARDMAKGRLKGAMLLFNNVVCLAFEALLLAGAYKMYFVTEHVVAVTVPQVRMSWLYIAMGAGTAMMFLCTLIDIRLSWKVLATGDTEGLRDGQSSPFMTQE